MKKMKSGSRLGRGDFQAMIVHNEGFHADDVMCAAIGKYINHNIQIKRMDKDIPEKELRGRGILVCNMGGGRYDHHQENAKIRQDTGLPYCACSLLLNDCWRLIFRSKNTYWRFVGKFMLPIEQADNGKGSNPLSAYISSFKPVWDSSETMDDAFMKAVDVLVDLIRRDVVYEEAEDRAKPLVRKALQESDGKIVVLDKDYPYLTVLRKSTAEFVIFPVDDTGRVHLRCIEEKHSIAPKKYLPASWLKDPPIGCTFVHQQLFVAAFDNLEHALSAAEQLESADDAE